MGVFSSIVEKIFGKEAAKSVKPSVFTSMVMAQAAAPEPAKPVAAAAAPVDVAAILDAAVKAKGQKLNWRKSIVDMMKALDLDSSLSARKELAAEFQYTGDTNDSAKMNIWLHKMMMRSLAENGGKIPAELLN